MLTLAEIPSFQKFFITAQTAKMADFIFQNMAYRATVYRTGCTTKKKGSGGADCPNIYTVLKGMHDILKNLSSSPTFDNLKLDANTFRQILAENIVFVTKAFKNRLVIPDFEVFCKNITRLVKI